jgi:hypothetical protein
MLNCAMPDIVSRTYDAVRVNALVNHPSVRPFVGGDGVSELDLTDAVADRRNIFLAGEHGGFAFSWSAPRTYEVHTFILPEGRGEWSRAFAMAARNWMQDHEATHLWTRVPADAENIRAFTEDAGFVPAGVDHVAGTDYDLYEWGPKCL